MTAAPAAGSPSLRAFVVRDEGALAAHRAAWTALADATSQPFCDPDLLLAWWRHARPARARLAVVVVVEDTPGGALVGVAPFFTDRGAVGIRWRPLGTRAFQRVGPLAATGREADVARAIVEALHGLRPRPQVLLFEGIALESPWPKLLAGGWPGSGSQDARIVVTGAATALTLDTAGETFDGWFAAKSSHFRQRLRRPRKALAAAGGVARLADAATAAPDIEAFIRLHSDRWADRGGSSAVPPAIAAALRDAGPGLVASGRLRVWSVDLDGETIASSLVFRAGSEAGYWLNGFDAAHARLEPSKVSILRVVEDAFALGAARLDLGEGDFAYKRRFADGEQTLVHLSVVPPTTPRVRAAVAVALPALRRRVADRLSDDAKARLRRRLRRSP
ncbi:MAG: cellulose biosynthesis (CelD)-like protein, partial [Solirubrobacterales bacterium]|nr:cellulose biosynthesis (CelD)-like protein [Solirubrobacterales bacterium]